MAVKILCLCQVISESDYELLFCNQNWVTYLCSDFGLLENMLSKASGKTELEQSRQSCGFGLGLFVVFLFSFFFF